MTNIEGSSKKEITQNPFVYNKPVRGGDFFNRLEIIKRLEKETVAGKSQGSVWITGERQVGKTSLLNYIQWHFDNYNKKIRLYETNETLNAAFVFLNTQFNRSRDDFYQNMLQSVKTYSDFKIEPLADSFGNFKKAIEYLLKEQRYYFFFLVDEFDALIANMAAADKEAVITFLAELNHITEGTGAIKFSCIFAANHTYDELMQECEIERRGSGLVVEPVELAWFTKKQVAELAHQYLENHSFRFNPQETDFCFQMTQGYPYFVQKLFSLMYDYKLENPGPKSYLAKVKEEYGSAFKETVKGWGAASTPKRTLEKLKGLAKAIGKTAGDRALKLVFKGVEEYLKKQIGI